MIGLFFELLIVGSVFMLFGALLVGLAAALNQSAHLNTVNQVARLGNDAENDISTLKEQAISDMFDAAREVRLTRLVGVDPEGGQP